MKTTGQAIASTLQYSFLILWSDNKQKWEAECIVLKIRLQADTYKEALEELVRAILNHNCSESLFDAIEKHKEDYSKYQP